MTERLRNLLIVSILFVFVSGCQAPSSTGEQPEAVEAPAQQEVETEATKPPPTEPPTLEPTEPPVISANQDSISVGEFEFRILRTASDSSVNGMKPADMNQGDQILYVEFDLLSGGREGFERLEPVLEGASGTSMEPIALVTNGQILTLTSLTFTGDPSSYNPEPESIAWAFVAAKGAGELYLVFPEGERIDLSPLLK